MSRRDNADPSGLGNTLLGVGVAAKTVAYCGNRVSADPQGKTVGIQTDADPVERREVDRERYSGL